MTIVASAPGKLVLLGEYAVLDGVPALVMAIDRRVRATLAPDPGPQSVLTMRTGTTATIAIEPGGRSGAGLIDAVIAAAPPLAWPAWRGSLDSAELFVGARKLGLGSSAAALTAWAGAWWAAAAPGAPLPSAATLISLHRAFQGGAGSGLDVAASRHGGIVEYRLEADFVPRIGSVPVPNSVGFAGIFAGSSASTVDFVGRYREWQGARPADARALRAAMHDVAVAGCAAARAGEGAGIIAAMAAYGDCLSRLGLAMNTDLVTQEHREIGLLARQFDVAYKVSGAGGGDLGVAASSDPERLSAFTQAASRRGFHVVALPIAEQGLVVEERA